jgi:aryl-alcohol dehydrogenase (NADP+)
MSMTTLAVAWVLAKPTITSAIIGASRPEQLADNVAALDVSLDGKLEAQLDELTAEWRRGDASR